MAWQLRHSSSEQRAIVVPSRSPVRDDVAGGPTTSFDTSRRSADFIGININKISDLGHHGPRPRQTSTNGRDHGDSILTWVAPTTSTKGIEAKTTNTDIPGGFSRHQLEKENAPSSFVLAEIRRPSGLSVGLRLIGCQREGRDAPLLHGFFSE